MKVRAMEKFRANHNNVKNNLKESFWENLWYRLGKDQYTATLNDEFMALSLVMRDRLIEKWILTQQRYHRNNMKRVYYLSLEFLIGRSLGMNMINLGLWDEAKVAMEKSGLDIDEIRDCETDAGLGNGGLGRLAACFLDSMATLGIPAHGYGIRYDYGIFKQKIINGNQIEFPDNWLAKGDPWEFARPEYTVRIRFYGRTNMYKDDRGKLHVEWVDTRDALAMPFDIPVAGYKNGVVNTLRLWSAKSTEDFDLKYFNDSNYEQAVHRKVYTETISKVLYPSDNASRGKELRLIQEYFFTAASLADIIRRFKTENTDLRKLHEKAAIQLNDTHPSLAVPELMRILVDEEKMNWDSAWKITRETLAYTNHTVMPEALEVWTVPLFEKVLPRHLEIIYEINSRFLSEAAEKFPGDNGRMRRMSIIEEGDTKRVRMAYLAIVGTHSVNGVSELHTELLKKELFKDFYELYPRKFNNKTNGITQRRWLLKSNYELSKLITGSIGSKWPVDFAAIEKLYRFKDDAGFRKKWMKVKRDNKVHLAKYILETTGITVDPDSMFDVQVKRIHEYKRQLLFALYIISQYLALKNNPKLDIVPRTFIVGGKAAPGYFMAKLIVKFINNVGAIINNDKSIKDKIKLVFLEDYRVSLAERIFPASDLSEQISTAGMEASGTGCMKFMMNGALTIGTYDGANIEIAEAAGKDNIFMFGFKVDEINKMKTAGYKPQNFIDRSGVLKDVIKTIRNNVFSPDERNIFQSIVDNLVYSDPYLICADFDSYYAAQEKVSNLYRNQNEWARKSIINVARSSPFSSDRTVMQYAKEIWDVPFDGEK